MILYGGLPHWLARTVGPLAHHGSLADDGTVLESPEQIRSHTQKEASQVEAATGLSAPVAALLLRHYGHSEIAIEQPLGTASGLLAAVFSGFGWPRSRRSWQRTCNGQRGYKAHVVAGCKG